MESLEVNYEVLEKCSRRLAEIYRDQREVSIKLSKVTESFKVTDSEFSRSQVASVDIYREINRLLMMLAKNSEKVLITAAGIYREADSGVAQGFS